MKRLTRRNFLGTSALAGGAMALSGCGLVSTTGMLGAGDRFPARNIEMSVGFSAGGSTDVLGRALADSAAEVLGRAIPVINRPGANGSLAADQLTRAPADGHFIGVVNASTVMITPFAVPENEAVQLEDLDLLMGTTRDDYILVTTPDSPYSNVEDLVSSGKRITYGTTGFGSGAQFAASLLFASAGIDGADIPFGGDSPAITAILGNQVDVASVQFSAAHEYVTSGKLKAVAVFSEQRNPQLPDAATAMEQGAEVVVSQYRLVCLPKGAPADNRRILTEAFTEAARSDRFLTQCEQMVVLPDFYPEEEVRTMIAEARDNYRRMLTEYGIDMRGQG
nr:MULTISPECIES: tripartite tricarboxylate transporter substrate binding protein [Brevibacterium]